MVRPLRRVVFSLGFLLLVVTGGTAGYMVLERARFLDALYMTVISVSTVGFSEVIELDDTGRILTMAVVVLGAGSVTYAAVNGIEFLVEGHLQQLVGRRRMDRTLERLQGHTIVCGFGQVGRHVVDQLMQDGHEAVVVDPNPERLEMASAREVAFIDGDATVEEILVQAGLKRARALVACAHDDADNVLITLTARGINPDVLVIARVKNDENELKAQRAGAGRVIAPAAIGGRRIAALVTHPAVIDFLDVVTRSADLSIVLEEVTLGDDSPLAGHSLRELDLRGRYGATVVALRQSSSSEPRTRPDPDESLGVGDTLVVIGSREDLDRLTHEVC